MDAIYQEAEQHLPTRYKEYESHSIEEYYKVKNNFYFLFNLAETIKKDSTIKAGRFRLEPALPYQVSAYTHQGKEVVLIERFSRLESSGMISRNVEDLTLELYLKDVEGNLRYRYLCSSFLDDFKEMKYEQIYETYGRHIPQGDTDDIEDYEVRFFLWTRPLEWSFSVVPVFRKQQRLYLGKETIFSFEDEQWVQNFFDGMK